MSTLVFYARLFEKKSRLERFVRRLFQYNSSTESNAGINHMVENCSFITYGPHRSVRLGIGATTILLLHIEHGFTIRNRKQAQFNSLNQLIRCSGIVSCSSCNVELYTTHDFLMVLGQRMNITCKMIQHRNRLRNKKSGLLAEYEPLPLIMLMMHNHSTNSYPRVELEQLLTECHQSDCPFKTGTYEPDVLDVFSANRFINEILGRLCEDCLYSTVEIEVVQQIVENEDALALKESFADQQKQLSRQNSDNTIRSTDEKSSDSQHVPKKRRRCRRRTKNNTNTTTESSTSNTASTSTKKSENIIDTTCQCCFENKALVNVPCGHMFQCEQCTMKMKLSLFERDEIYTLLDLPPCSVCRSPVLMNVSIYT